MVPRVVPKMVPKMEARMVPKMVPNVVPRMEPRVVPNVVPRMEAIMVPKMVPRVVPDVVPGVASLTVIRSLTCQHRPSTAILCSKNSRCRSGTYCGQRGRPPATLRPCTRSFEMNIGGSRGPGRRAADLSFSITHLS